jgi:thymidine phosphorylase
VGRGIGPALEARDVLSVLRRAPDAPADLRERALSLAGRVLEIGGAATTGCGVARATTLLDGGSALRKFEAICEAQGGMREPITAPITHMVRATEPGRISAIDNRRLARLAKLAGAPRSPAAGVTLCARVGERVERGEPLLVIHAASPGQLEYARGYLAANPELIDLDES